MKRRCSRSFDSNSTTVECPPSVCEYFRSSSLSGCSDRRRPCQTLFSLMVVHITYEEWTIRIGTTRRDRSNTRDGPKECLDISSASIVRSIYPQFRLSLHSPVLIQGVKRPAPTNLPTHQFSSNTLQDSGNDECLTYVYYRN